MSRIRELEQLITYHKALYYQGRPEISDEAYDKLEAELGKKDPQNPVLSLVGSPVDSIIEKVAHSKKMLSLDKTYEASSVVDFLGQGELVSVFKIDGSSCSLIYDEGHLVMAKTRGDGSFGENIMPKAAFIPDIPKTISHKGLLEVRGEIFCRSASFHHLVHDMEELKLEKPTSLRNIVAGLLGRKEHIMLSRHLSFQAFDLLEARSPDKTEIQKFKRLNEMGFDCPTVTIHKDAESIGKTIEEAKKFIQDGDYLIDGLVFVLNDLRLHDELGETSHHPRYKLAFKFQGETKVTKIEAITWQVSRNGVLTPVAEIAPTELSGAQISRVTLHNMGVVVDFELRPGDEIEIVRSGEVIPKFLSVAKKTPGEPSIPLRCPSCDSKLRREDIRLICDNDACPAKQLEGILHWIRQVNIEDLSEKRLQEMINKKMVTEIADLYRLKMDDLLALDKVKEKLAQKLSENIQKTKHLSLVTFLAGLGVDGVSYTKAEKIVLNGYDTLEKILSLSAETLALVEGFAEKSSQDIVASIASKKGVIKSLMKAGIEVKAPRKIEGGALSGKKICITGSLSVPRAEMEMRIKEQGGIMVSSVSKNTDILLTNDTDPQSSKYKKALEVGTQVLNEEAFEKLIKG